VVLCGVVCCCVVMCGVCCCVVLCVVVLLPRFFRNMKITHVKSGRLFSFRKAWHVIIVTMVFEICSDTNINNSSTGGERNVVINI